MASSNDKIIGTRKTFINNKIVEEELLENGAVIHHFESDRITHTLPLNPMANHSKNSPSSRATHAKAMEKKF